MKGGYPGLCNTEQFPGILHSELGMGSSCVLWDINIHLHLDTLKDIKLSDDPF